MTQPDVTDLDRLVLAHYRVWLAFTAESPRAILLHQRYIATVAYLALRGFSGWPDG